MKTFNYGKWSIANRELHELYKQTMITDEFKEKDAELTKQIDELKKIRRKLRAEETTKENVWVCQKLKEAGVL